MIETICCPCKSVPSSSFGLETLGGMGIGTGMCFDHDGMLIITRYIDRVGIVVFVARPMVGGWVG